MSSVKNPVVLSNETKTESLTLELKSFKFYPRLSEETNCFDTNLYVDGKKVGYAKNSGTGGCTDYRIENKELSEKLEAWAKLFPLESVDVGGGEMFKMDSNLENLIDDMVCTLITDQEKAKFEAKLKKEQSMFKTSNLAKGLPFTYTWISKQTYTSEVRQYVGLKNKEQIPLVLAKYNLKPEQLSEVV